MASPYNELLDESRELERRARAVQGDFELQSSEEEIDKLVSNYHEWLARGVRVATQ